jgi:hypothetical protein
MTLLPLSIEHTRPFLLAAGAAALASAALHLMPALWRLYLPRGLHLPSLDPAVMLLFGPLCVLIFAILFEAARLIRHGLPDDRRPAARPIAHWQDAAS